MSIKRKLPANKGSFLVKMPQNNNFCKICFKKVPSERHKQALYCSIPCANKFYTKNHRVKYKYDYPKQNKELVVEFFGNRCKKCKRRKNLEIDHIIPIYKGGKNKIKNIQILCRTCHRKKTKIDLKDIHNYI